MPRVARIKGESGIYHIMLRGINQQLIFENNDDKLKIIDMMRKRWNTYRINQKAAYPAAN